MADSPGLFALEPADYWDTLVQVSGSNFTTNSSALIDITGLTFAAAINSVYEIECVLKYSANVGNGIGFAVTCSAAGSTGDFMFLSDSSNGTFLGNANVIGTATSLSYGQSLGDNVAEIKTVVTTVGSTGNITIQTRNSATDVITVYVGSIMKIRKLA